MTFVESITTCFKKSFTIKGRACRSEYWWFHLLWVICYFSALILAPAAEGSDVITAISWMIFGVMIISIIPLFTASIRRLHDDDAETRRNGFRAWKNWVRNGPSR